MITLDEAIKQINDANPILGDLLNCEKTLTEYCEEKIMNQEFTPTHLERQKIYKKLIKEKVEKLFPNEDININLDGGLVIDTTDHHHVLNHPTIIGAHIMSRFNTILDRKNHGDFFVMDSGNVNLFEVLNRRGFMIGGRHINLYPKDDKNKLVSGYPIFKYDIVKSAINSGHKFSEEENQIIKKIQSIIDGIDFSQCERLSDQIVKINFYLWKEFFGDDVRDVVRRCVTLEHDEILIKALQEALSKNENIISKALFNDEYRKLVIERFDGIYGAWNYSGENTGTYFFWGFNHEDGKRYKMIIRDNYLVCPEGKVKDIEIIPEEIIKALKNKVLIPSIITKFGFAATWMGAKLMGGSGQTEYAVKLHQAWLDILEKSDTKEFELAKNVNVNTFNAGDMSFIRTKEGKIEKCFGFDIVIKKVFNKEFINNLGKMKFKYFLYPFIELSYYRLTPADKRQKIECTEEELYRGFNWIV